MGKDQSIKMGIPYPVYTLRNTQKLVQSDVGRVGEELPLAVNTSRHSSIGHIICFTVSSQRDFSLPPRNPYLPLTSAFDISLPG